MQRVILRWGAPVTALAMAAASVTGCGGGTSLDVPDGGPREDAGGPPGDGGATDPLDVLLADVERELMSTGAPGWGIAVVEDGAIVRTRAGGLACADEPGRPVETSTPFRVLRLAEMLTAIAALEAAAAGDLDLDAPAMSLLPAGVFVIEPAEWAGNITVRDLIFQSSGLPARIRIGTFDVGPTIEACTSPDSMSMDAWIGSLATHRMGAPPGLFQMRDTTSPVLLARILVETDGRSLPEIVRARVLDPAGMSQTDIGWDPARAASYACGHESGGFAVMKLSATGLCEAHQPLNLAFSSIDDLARFAQILALRGSSPEGEPIFAASTIQAVTQGGDVPSWIAAGLRAGVGMQPWITDAGTVPAMLEVGFGFGVGIAVSPEHRFAAVVVRNESESPWYEGLQPILAARLPDALEGPLPVNRQYSPDRHWDPDADVLAAFAGRYVSVIDDVLTLTVESTTVRFDLPSRAAMGPLELRLPDRFNAPVGGAQFPVRVHRDAADLPAVVAVWGIDHPFWRDAPPAP